MNKIAFIDYMLLCNWDDEILADLIGIPTSILRMWINGEAEPNQNTIYRVAGWISVKLNLKQDEVFNKITGSENGR